jgi:hypothetical protein
MQSLEHLDRGRLAGAIRTEQTETDPALDVEIDARDGQRVTETLR